MCEHHIQYTWHHVVFLLHKACMSLPFHAWNRHTVYINSSMEQECIDKYTVNNYLGSTKFLQLQDTAAVHLFESFCKVCMEESSSRTSAYL